LLFEFDLESHWENGVNDGNEVNVATGAGDDVRSTIAGVAVPSTGWQADIKNIKINACLIMFAIGFFLSRLFICRKPPFEL
jgi:hypothetical protein